MLLGKVFASLGKYHAGKISEATRFDPQLLTAIKNKINGKLSIMCTNFEFANLNEHQEMMQNIICDGIGADAIDGVLDVYRYGTLALRAAKYKAGTYASIYGQALEEYLPKATRFDLRKGEITEAEVNSAMKKLFWA